MDFDYTGWHPSDKFVCWRCVRNDDYLAEQLRVAGEEDAECSYCRGDGAASLDVLIELTSTAVYSRWQDADEYPGVYSSADGGYQFPTRELKECVDELICDYVYDGNIASDVVEAFDYRLVADADDDSDWFRGDSWEDFSRLVRHHVRYMFWTDSNRFERGGGAWWGDRPVAALEYLAQRLQEHGMLGVLGQDARIWRARGHQGPGLAGGATARSMGTVPEHLATVPNRMSAPGIPMFYGSLDSHTAVVEATRHGDPTWDHATVGAFSPTRDLIVLDLRGVAVPGEPSVFLDTADERHQKYAIAKFLERFIDSVSRPADEDGARRGIEYVPTQLFTEFVLHAMGQMVDPPQSIDGIVYPSAEVESGANIVLDVSNWDCTDTAPSYSLPPGQVRLVLDPKSVVVAKRSWTFGPGAAQPTTDESDLSL